MKTSTSYGMWVSGHEPSIAKMVRNCLENMEANGKTIPKDEFGMTKFSVSYIYRPILATVNGGDDFTAIKLIYDVDIEESDEGQEQPGS